MAERITGPVTAADRGGPSPTRRIEPANVWGCSTAAEAFAPTSVALPLVWSRG
jgi:hypothetical protein